MPEAASAATVNQESLAGELEANPVDAKRAYELMVGKLSGEFDVWDDLPVATRGTFKARFAQVQSLPIFEQCCAELLLGQ